MEPQPKDRQSSTLSDLLYQLNLADQDLIEFDWEKQKEMIDETKLKVDAYKYILDRYQLLIDQKKAEIDEIRSVVKSLESQQTALKGYLKYGMEKFGFQKLSGKRYTVSIQSRKSLSLAREPDTELAFKFPDFVRVKREWEINKIKQEIIGTDREKEFEGLIQVEEKSGPVFRVKKELS